MTSHKDFDKAVIIHQGSTHTLAAIGKKSDPAPSGIGLFENGPPVEPGKPLVGDVLFNREEDGTFSMTHLPKTNSLSERHGPAQVASHMYRTNYERIFGKHDLN